MREVIVVSVIVCAILFGSSFFLIKKCSTMVEEAGGTKGIIVETGKEIKSIIKEIDESK